MQLSLPMASLANISLPSALLEERASGEIAISGTINTLRSHLSYLFLPLRVFVYFVGQRSVVVASVLFTTLQSFLPSASSSSSRR